MLVRQLVAAVGAALSVAPLAVGFDVHSYLEESGLLGRERLVARGLPKEPTGVQTITSPNGIQIRYKEPGKDGVCETTPGKLDPAQGISWQHGEVDS